MGAPRVTYPEPTEVTDFITDTVATRGFPPSVREVSAHFDIRHHSTHRMLDQLEADGYIRRAPGVARGIQVVERDA